ncbi:hypothetical protein F5Y13DRAFT_45843 [Hypoxylon sp. FL1857]|nr:hypothetical protein F5Y13DRAFT_45843 [Hypoxylon sp. FL1857]
MVRILLQQFPLRLLSASTRIHTRQLYRTYPQPQPQPLRAMSSAPNSSSDATTTQEAAAASNNENGQHQPLPLPEPTHNGDTTELPVGGEGVKLDKLGPLVVNEDGTMSRIANWAEMAEIERQNTLRILGKRNQLRLDALKAKGQNPESQSQ